MKKGEIPQSTSVNVSLKQENKKKKEKDSSAQCLDTLGPKIWIKNYSKNHVTKSLSATEDSSLHVR